MKTVAIDPSGNFDSGKGHTGIATMDGCDFNTIAVQSVNAKDYATRLEYWNAVLDTAIQTVPCMYVIESYVVRSNGFTIGKMPETAMLIGVLIHRLETLGLPYVFQSPSMAKTRFKDDLLPYYIPKFIKNEHGRYMLDGKPTNDHERDALKHLLFYKRYKEIT